MNLVQYTVWVPRPLKTLLKRIAKREGKTLSALSRPILEEFAEMYGARLPVAGRQKTGRRQGHEK